MLDPRLTEDATIVQKDSTMILDLFLFFVILILCLSVFAVFHVAALCFLDPRRLLVFLASLYFLGALAASVFSFLFIANHFSSFECYLTSNVGAVLAGFFASALYSFLGPATADRSLTAHFLIFLLEQPDRTIHRNRVLERFSPRNFLEKRYDECQRAEIIQMETNTIQLTKKGESIARIYAFGFRLLNLGSRSQFLDSFPKELERHDSGEGG